MEETGKKNPYHNAELSSRLCYYMELSISSITRRFTFVKAKEFMHFHSRENLEQLKPLRSIKVAHTFLLDLLIRFDC